MSAKSRVEPFVFVAIVIQLIHVVLFALFTDYDMSFGDSDADVDPAVNRYYHMFMGVSIMLLMGFGFLMTFLRRYAFSSVALNLMITAQCCQFAILVVGFFESAAEEHPFAHKIKITMPLLINANFSAATALVSMGALLGKVSPTQLLLVTWVEQIFFGLNLYIIVLLLKAVDIGGSMAIHSFGAYYGLACSVFLSSRGAKDHADNSSGYNNDLFAMIGTMFLWLYWPSFNSALARPFQQLATIVNTFVCLLGSAFVAFICSRLYRGHNKFDMVDIQNATISGGVAIGSAADLFISPVGALCVGIASAIISCAGYVFVQPFLLRKFKLHDSCGVHNLHGMPGVFGAIVSAIAVSVGKPEQYGKHFDIIFPWGAAAHGGIQMASLGITLGIAIVSGLCTSFIVSRMCPSRTYYSDDENWEVPSDFPPSKDFMKSESTFELKHIPSVSSEPDLENLK